MSNFPPPVPPAVPPPAVTYAPPAPQPRPANAWAIVSLVCGIIGCLVITPLIAVVCGIIGLGKARLQGGRGMAITGIILGVLWIVGGLVAIGGGVAAVKYGSGVLAGNAKPQAIVLINRVNGGDLSLDRTTGTLTAADLAAIAATAKPLGDCRDISITGSSLTTTNGVLSVSFNGTATFEKGTTPINATVHNAGGRPQAGTPAAWEFDRLDLK